MQLFVHISDSMMKRSPGSTPAELKKAIEKWFRRSDNRIRNVTKQNKQYKQYIKYNKTLLY